MAKSIRDLLLEYYKRHSKEECRHGPVVDWVESRYKRLYGKKPRDTWRAIRLLHQEGILIKVKKGIYKYDPDHVRGVELFEFPPDVKEAIFKKDNYKCVVCGKGRTDGVEICADHIRPKDKGGTNTADNGQTLCMQHNLIKKNYSQTESGKRYFIKLYKQAVAKKDKRMIDFCRAVFDVYNNFGINGHIQRPNGGIKYLRSR
jgi:5-methylcytosine-specific restriction endonuclease McrA